MKVRITGNHKCFAVSCYSYLQALLTCEKPDIVVMNDSLIMCRLVFKFF